MGLFMGSGNSQEESRRKQQYQARLLEQQRKRKLEQARLKRENEERVAKEEKEKQQQLREKHYKEFKNYILFTQKQKEVQQANKRAAQEIKKLSDKLKQSLDPNQNPQLIQRFSIESTLQKIPGKFNYLVVGTQGCGKSTLLSKATGKKLDIGLGGTSDPCVKVHTDKNVTLWQVLTQDSCFEILGQEIGMFKSADKIFILYDYSLKSCENVVKSVAGNKFKNVYFIRTKCDNFDARQARTLQQELEVDRMTLKSWRIEYERKIYVTAMLHLDSFGDNHQVIKMLLEVDQ